MSAKDSTQDELETKNVTQERDNKSSEPEEQREQSTSQSSSSKSPEVEEADKETKLSDSNLTLESELQNSEVAAAPVTQWQAIWAPQYSAYYFYNSITQETTWTNPLQLQASSSYATSSADQAAPGGSLNNNDGNEQNADASSSVGLTTAASHYSALQAAAIAQGIDPGLAHLDPTLLASVSDGSSVPSEVPTFTAQFNAHTGKFAAASSRTPGHLSEYERMKRMSEFYFDVNKWEEDIANQHEEESSSGKKRKRPTKKDLERFKEQKRLKKIAKTAWLRT